MSAEEQSNDARRLVFGLTGPFGSGCSEVARTLEKERGYCVIRVSNILADEARNGGTELPDAAEERRGVLQQLGNDLRKEEGLDILVRKALESLTTEECSGPIVVDSIKNPGEIDKLKELPNAYVIAVDASREKRWARIAEQSQYDQKRFLRNDEIDRDEGIEYGQKVQACVDRADIIVANEEDWHNSVRKKSLFDYKVLQYIELLERPGYREPSVSELVMQHAYATSLRSRCLSRRVGAVIVLQENPNGPFYVLATGYNHAPLGSYECTEEWGRCY